tara:strand:- start:435 stop:899 length:465 start_codon:yes stop_codon:yes gene_type:complete
MIQFSAPDSVGYHLIANTIYLNIYDEYTSTTVHRSLWTITSQFTKKSKTYLPSTNYSNKDRYVSMNTVTTTGSDNLTGGIINLGTTDFPLGFYDVTIYQNSSDSNLDPTGLKVVYNGLMNLISINATTGVETPPVTYTEYTTNDSDTESVYITF